jgi:hypothetical protein
MQSQLTFPEITDSSTALRNLSVVEQEAKAIAESYHNTLAKMHAVGDFLCKKKSEIANSNFVTFLEENFNGYELDYLRKLMRFSREQSREDIQTMALKTCGKQFQALLGLPEPKEVVGPKPLANPTTAAANMNRLLRSFESRYGGVEAIPTIERRQLVGVFKPIFERLSPLFSASELRKMADDIDLKSK